MRDIVASIATQTKPIGGQNQTITIERKLMRKRFLPERLCVSSLYSLSGFSLSSSWVHKMKNSRPEKNNNQIEKFREKLTCMFSDPTRGEGEK